MSSLIVFSIEQYWTFILTNKKVGLWNRWGRWGRRGGGGASAPVAPPLPMSLAFLNYFFHFRGVHSRSCIMGNHGKMAGYWKIFIGIQSQLFLPEFIYLIVSLWKELLPSSKKQYTKSEIAKMSVTSFKKTSIFPYIFCHFDTVELQKMYGKNQGFLKTDHRLLFMSVVSQQSTTTVDYCTSILAVSYRDILLLLLLLLLFCYFANRSLTDDGA